MAPITQIRRVLIANRGEIARRIIRTCQRLGIETVAAYSDVDRHSPHVREATHSVCIGASDAYLSIESIIGAAKASSADAIHPGYGFLSENPALPEACSQHGLCFIGPSAGTMRALGSKTAAKIIAQESNVPTAPTLIFSSDPTNPLADQLTAFAERVGYPVVLKAAAGGGGRGMRFITRDSIVALEIESARREAQKAFGSPEIFAERCITPARHVEVQVAADSHGDVVALGTRDCTLQRSNQKMIEEAPAVALRAGLTEELCEAACRLAKKAHYRNLGTVEFLCSPDGGFYFLEVNTRLQVEHPVTEMVTGLDLVELQVRLAEGTRLSECGVTATVQANGHAIEARLCAEDYIGQFVLSAGIVQEFEIPTREAHGAVVRVDAGVEPCSEVTHYYDSLIAKVIVHAATRSAAIEALREVLSRSRISGVKTNRGTLVHLLACEPFAALTHSIQGTSTLLPTDDERRTQALLAHAIAATYRTLKPLSHWASSSPWLAISGEARSLRYPWRTSSSGISISSQTTVTETGATVECRTGDVTVTHTCSVDDLFPAQPDGDNLRLHIDSGSSVTKAAIRRDGQTYWVHLPSGTTALEERLRDAVTQHGAGAQAGREITAHIPGKIAALVSKIGDHVAAGQVILVLDSMKMEHPIKAPNAGVVKELPAQAGTIVQAGSLLAVIEDD